MMAREMLEREDGEAQLDDGQDKHDAEEDGHIPKKRALISRSLVVVGIGLVYGFILSAEHDGRCWERGNGDATSRRKMKRRIGILGRAHRLQQKRGPDL